MTEPENPKPILIYDGACGFCGIWVDYWRRATAGQVDFAPSQQVASSYPQIVREDFARSVQLVLPSGETSAGAKAVFETLAFDPDRRWLLRAYESVPGFAGIAEASYRMVAAHRSVAYWITVALFGRTVSPLQYDSVQALFLKLLAIVYLIAFASFGAQASGLIGSHGILPVAQYLPRITEFAGASGYRLAPTLLWLNTSDAAIRAVWIGGVLSAVLVLVGVFSRPALAAAFVLYLSLASASQEFLSFQWDFLLLEAGFLAIFLGYSWTVVWLFRWLLFRLMLFSGLVKLMSHDVTWRNLTALTVHYQTQPIPTPAAWYAHQLPLWFQQFSCAGVFFIELIIPIFVLGPRRARLFALPWFLALQLLIAITGNYAFFNLLTLSLCVFLIDDALLGRVLPLRWLRPAAKAQRIFVPLRVRRIVAWSLAIVVGTLSLLLAMQSIASYTPAGGRTLLAFAAPFGITNSYGLFASMTTTRPEIIVEGSEDGSQWRAYEFKYKPGALTRRPPWVAPYQPRLDWQMWFAALGSYRENIWFVNFLARLLQGRPEVLDLIARNPFPDRPPNFVRARVSEYKFTDAPHRERTGEWWTSTPLGVYIPPVSLESLSRLPILQTPSARTPTGSSPAHTPETPASSDRSALR